MLSIGGWTYSSSLAQGASTSERRKKFAKSAVELLKTLGLDGLDIDWEYPQNAEQAEQYVDLLHELRLELDAYALKLNLPRNQFELSIAAPAGPENIRNLKIAEMDQYLDFWNIMAYDYAGSWSSKVQHQANLFGSGAPDELSTDTSLKYYINAGVHPNKLVIGMPLYGRAFTNTDGFNCPFNGVGEGSWENGAWDYKSLPRPNAQEQVDNDRVAAYCYDPSTRTFVTYDNVETTKRKAEYIKQRGLGGGMWWESSADCPVGSGRSLVETFTNAVGLNNLESRSNNLKYPESPHENLNKTSV